MNFLQKIQNLPLKTRKIILWTVAIVIGLILFSFLIGTFSRKIKIFKEEILSEPRLKIEQYAQ